MKRLSLIFLTLALTACTPNTPNDTANESPTTPILSEEAVPFSTAQDIINARCLGCHSEAPTQAAFGSAPAGVKFDTPEEIKAKADRIRARAVTSKSMPPNNNVTEMTDAERQTLGIWIDQGAKIE